MKIALVLLLALSALPGCGWNRAKSVAPSAVAAGPVIDHAVTDIDGQSVALSAYRGKAVLIVNTASECGFTPQYEGLQALQERYGARGFTVLGFPSNDFMGQEPGTNAEIKSFCSAKFHITFPMFSKLQVDAGDGQAPLYKTLTTDTPEGLSGEIKWNFTKFLVNPEGHVVARFEPAVEPTDSRVTTEIEKWLPAKAAASSPTGP